MSIDQIEKPTTLEDVEEAKVFLQSKLGEMIPTLGLILGTGLGKVTEQIENKITIPYEEIPHFSSSTVISHTGQLVFGQLSGKTIMAMEGRYHFYEGHSLKQITFPVRVMKALGIDIMIVSNAAGGLNSQYQKGDIVLIEDHINFMGLNPLIGPNHEKLGPRFPDMIEPYQKELMRLSEDVATEQGLNLHKGVYVGVTGPCLETRAEYRMMRTWGADMVGMSTIPEVIVAVHAGLKVLGLSVITDMCIPESLEPINIEEIIKTAQSAGPKLDKLIKGVLNRL